MEGKKELLEQLDVVKVLASENPCGMSDSVLGGLVSAVKAILGDRWSKGGSRDRVAAYLERDPRTITRWREEYNDFPKARHDGHKEVSYNWVDVVRWKLKHSELYEK